MRRSCQGCPDRTPGCHDRCADHQARQAQRGQVKAWRKDHLEADCYDKARIRIRTLAGRDRKERNHD